MKAEEDNIQEKIKKVTLQIESKKAECQDLASDNQAKSEEFSRVQLQLKEQMKQKQTESKPTVHNEGEEEEEKMMHQKAKKAATPEEMQLAKVVQKKITDLIDEKISILKKKDFKHDNEETSFRPFVNSITVKISAKEIAATVKKKKKDEYIEQKFRITKQTNFEDLKNAACEFWDLDKTRYSIYDENYHDLMSLNQDPGHLAHNVEKYFEIVRLKNVATLFLLRPDQEKTQLLSLQREAIRIRGEFTLKGAGGGGGGHAGDKGGHEIHTYQARQFDKQNEKENMRNFLTQFPGMEKYLLSYKNHKNFPKSHLESPDLKFCTMFVCLLLLILTSISLFSQRDLNQNYWQNQLVINQLNSVQSSNSQPDPLYLQFDNVTTTKEFYQFVINTIGDALYDSSSNAATGAKALLFQNSLALGKMRIRQQRSSQKEQTNCFMSTICYYSNIGSGQQTGTLYDGTQSWQTFYTSDNANSTSSAYGENEIYDGSGYILDVSLNMTREDYKSYMTKILSDNTSRFVNSSTRVVFLNFNFYTPSIDLFVSVECMFEFMISGVIVPTHLSIMQFKANVFELSGEKFVESCDIFRFILCFYIFYSLFIKIAIYRTKTTLSNLLLICFLDLSLLFTFYFRWIILYIFANMNTFELLNSPNYIDCVGNASWHQQSYIIDSLCFFVIIIKIVQVLRLSRLIHWVMLTIDRAIIQIFSFLIVLIPCFIGFTFFLYIVFGPQIDDYHTFGMCMRAVLFFTLGQVETEELYRSNFIIGVIWSFCLWVFLIFIFLSSFMAIFVVAYEQTIKELGYPTDYKALAKWEYKSYFFWAIEWVPSFIYKRRINQGGEDDNNSDGEHHHDDSNEGVIKLDGE